MQLLCFLYRLVDARRQQKRRDHCSERAFAVGGAFLKCLMVADVYLSPYRIPMPMREQGLGEDDWQMENHPLGKLGVEAEVL